MNAEHTQIIFETYNYISPRLRILHGGMQLPHVHVFEGSFVDGLYYFHWSLVPMPFAHSTYLKPVTFSLLNPSLLFTNPARAGL